MEKPKENSALTVAVGLPAVAREKTGPGVMSMLVVVMSRLFYVAE